MGDEVLRHQVLVAAARRVHEERVAPVHRHHEELRHRPALAQPGEDRARGPAAPRSPRPRRGRGARRRPGTSGCRSRRRRAAGPRRRRRRARGRRTRNVPGRTSAAAGAATSRASATAGRPEDRRREEAHRINLTRRARWRFTLREDRVEGARGEAAGEGVLLGDVERAEEPDAAAEVVDGAVAEGEAPGQVAARLAEHREEAVHGDAAEDEDGPQVRRGAPTRGRGTRGSGRSPPGSACWRGARSARPARCSSRAARGRRRGRSTPAGSRSRRGAGRRTGSRRSGRR